MHSALYQFVQFSVIRFRWKRVFLLVWSLSVMTLTPTFAQSSSANVGADDLGHALDYFASGKYHEALILFKQLNKQYKLNPRFKAYTALCYYHEWEYKEAVKWFDENIPLLEGLSPSELSVYSFAAAESYFNLNQYDKAIPYYNRTLALCYPRDRADNYYRLGFCYHLLRMDMTAQAYFMLADYYFTQYRNNEETISKRAQITHMVKGLSVRALKELNRNYERSLSLQRDGRDSSEEKSNTTQ